MLKFWRQKITKKISKISFNSKLSFKTRNKPLDYIQKYQ